jgi:hypothetical protein
VRSRCPPRLTCWLPRLTCLGEIADRRLAFYLVHIGTMPSAQNHSGFWVCYLVIALALATHGNVCRMVGVIFDFYLVALFKFGRYLLIFLK